MLLQESQVQNMSRLELEREAASLAAVAEMRCEIYFSKKKRHSILCAAKKIVWLFVRCLATSEFRREPGLASNFF